MTKRIILAGILGGIAMFMWMFIAHIVLPLGQVGISEIPNEQPVLAAMQGQIGASSGLYLFPGMGLGPNATRAQKNAAMKDYEQKLATTPSGLLLYHPPGNKGITPARLGLEFLFEVIESILLVFLIAKARITSFGGRLGFATAAGLLAAIPTNASYWNWYGFPANYTQAYIFMQWVAFVCVGLVAGWMLKSEADRGLAARA
jgi:hypothetical protein